MGPCFIVVISSVLLLPFYLRKKLSGLNERAAIWQCMMHIFRNLVHPVKKPGATVF